MVPSTARCFFRVLYNNRRCIGGSPTSAGLFEASQVAELNGEMKSIFGPLGDPDYDGEDVSVGNAPPQNQTSPLLISEMEVVHQNKTSSQLAELNSEIKSILGPLGDPDYDGDEVSVGNAPPQNQAASPHLISEMGVMHQNQTSPQNSPPHQRDNKGDGLNSIERLRAPSSTTSRESGAQDPVRAIVDAHCRELTSNMQKVLDTHHLRLTSALETEVYLRDLRKS